MAFSAMEPSEAFLRAMEARVSMKASMSGVNYLPSSVDDAPTSAVGGSFSSSSRPPEASEGPVGLGAGPSFKIAGPPPLASKPLLSQNELQRLLAGGDSAAQVRTSSLDRYLGAPSPAPPPVAVPAASSRKPAPVAAGRQPKSAPTRRAPPVLPPQRSTLPTVEAASEQRRPRADSAFDSLGYNVVESREAACPELVGRRVSRTTNCVPELDHSSSSGMHFLQDAERFLASRDVPKPVPGYPPARTNSSMVQIPEEAATEDAQSCQDNAEEQPTAEASALYAESEYEGTEADTHQIDGVTYAEVGAGTRHIPSIVTFGGVPAAQDGDLVYLGGGLYANAASDSPPKRKAAPKRARSRVLPGRARPGPQAPVSGIGRSASQPPPTQPQTNEYGFMMPNQCSPVDVAPAKEVPSAPPAWRPGGIAKRPPAKVSEPNCPPPASTGGHDDGIMMPMEGAYGRQPLDAGPVHSEARVRERESIRQDGHSLFGRKGMLREIAAMQMPMMPVAPRTQAPGTGPMASDIRAEERRMSRESRVQALLEEANEHEKFSREQEHERARNLGRGLNMVSSAPVLPSLSSSLGPAAKAKADELERQQLRVACKMEKLSFLNGYHNALGKMSIDQKASLLAKLHASKNSKPPPAPCARTGTNSSTPEAGWEWNAQMEAESGVHERLQHVNDMCNEAFEFDTEL